MANSILAEHLITLKEAAKRMPRRRRGTKIAVSTLHRWASSGVGGTRLETVKIGGMRYTSWPAVERFCSVLTDASAPKTPTATQIERDAKDAGERLKELGF